MTEVRFRGMGDPLPPSPPGIPRAPRLRLDAAFSQVKVELNELALQRPQGAHYGHDAPWAWFGSVVMLLHGLELGFGRAPSDLDVFVDGWIWQQLANRVAWAVELPDPADPPFVRRRCWGVDVCAFYRWTGQDPEVNADHCRLVAQHVQGHWAVPLSVIRTHKLMAAKHGAEGRYAKHAADVAIIEAHLDSVEPGWRG